MAPVPTLHFGPFALDGTDDGLWRGPERCKLTAKAEAVPCIGRGIGSSPR
jgi:hypothetical protein